MIYIFKRWLEHRGQIKKNNWLKARVSGRKLFDSGKEISVGEYSVGEKNHR